MATYILIDEKSGEILPRQYNNTHEAIQAAKDCLNLLVPAEGSILLCSIYARVDSQTTITTNTDHYPSDIMIAGGPMRDYLPEVASVTPYEVPKPSSPI